MSVLRVDTNLPTIVLNEPVTAARSILVEPFKIAFNSLFNFNYKHVFKTKHNNYYNNKT